MSTEEGFLDVLYLGIFVILSSAFDSRFYASSKPPPVILDEIKCATSHFRALFHFFSSRFIILLEDELFAPSYVFDRMLGEFAAAAVVFSKGVQKARGDLDVVAVQRASTPLLSIAVASLVIRPSLPVATTL